MKLTTLVLNPWQRIIYVAVLLVALLPSVALAAYCSLRDPILAIRSLYPDVTQHRSIVRPVDQKIREQISQRLPFTLHFNEIGKHTLYLASKGAEPLGFVQARSELSEWGMIELAWAINPDLTVEGLDFQRCRSNECSEKLKSTMQSLLKGRSFYEILPLISEDGFSLSVEAKTLLPEQHSISLTILRSALKTLAVTELAWADVIVEIALLSENRPGE